MIKKNSPNSVLIVIDGSKVSLGWKDAEDYVAAKGGSLGTIRIPSSGERIKWTVRTRGDLNSIISHFEKTGRKMIIVDGSGKAIGADIVGRHIGRNNNSDRTVSNTPNNKTDNSDTI